MRVLLADEDHTLLGLMRTTLEGAGYEVGVCHDASDLENALRRMAPALVVLDVDHGRGESRVRLGRWRTTTPGSPAQVVLTGGRSDADSTVAEAQQVLDAGTYLQKPFSLFDFESLLGRLCPVRPREARGTPSGKRSAPPESGSGVVGLMDRARSSATTTGGGSGALRLLARLWSTEATGFLVWARPAGEPRRVGLVDGGLVGDQGWAALSDALRDGTPSFERGVPVGDGDGAVLGRLLFQMARRAADPGSLATKGTVWVRPLASVEKIVDLPLRPQTLGVLGGGGGTIDEMIPGDKELQETVLMDLAALVELGLAELGQAPSMPAERKDAPGQAPVEHTVPAPVRSQTGRQPSASGPVRSHSARGSSRSTSSGARGRRAVGQALRSSPSGARRRRQARASAGPATGTPAPARLHRQLKGELDRLVDAPPPVVLGIPADSAIDLVDQAGSRLRERYNRLAEQADMPTSVRVISRRLAELVDEAHRVMAARAGQDAMDDFAERPTDMAMQPVLSQEDELLERGEALIQRAEWEQADKVLTRARDLCLGHAGILSGLAWARFHSETRAADERIEEARDLLLLAEQFGGESDARVQRRLAHVLLAEGSVDKALKRGKRALRLEPGGPDADALRTALSSAETPPE